MIDSVPAFIRPQLAQSVPRDADLSVYAAAWSLEPKLNGRRVCACVSHGSELAVWSRPRGSEPPHSKDLPAPIAKALTLLPTGVYDGEFFVPGGRSSHAARLDRQDEAVVGLFDVMFLNGGPTVAFSYAYRRALLTKAVGAIARRAHGLVQLVPAFRPSAEQLAAWLEAGGEGGMLKRLTSLYNPGMRSWDWLKCKKYVPAEMTVIALLPGLNGPNARLELRADDGAITRVKRQRDGFENQPDALIGRRVLIEHQGRTESGSFISPMFDRVLE